MKRHQAIPDGISSSLITRFAKINVWKQAGVRAPHKPLLILYALGKLLRGGQRLTSYQALDKPIRELLQEFGPYRKSYHSEYPFWWLQTDKLWEVRTQETPRPRTGKKEPGKTELLRVKAVGGFPQDIYQLLLTKPELVAQVARQVLDAHFPETLHDEIRTAVGLPAPETVITRQRRDPAFRQKVLTAYDYRCGICGFNVRLGNTLLALDAAHIRWKQANGPDIPTNGVAMCTLHHRLFDRGAFTVATTGTILVSTEANGTAGLQEWLLAYHGQALLGPQHTDDFPRSDYLVWHQREVFHGGSGACLAASKG